MSISWLNLTAETAFPPLEQATEHGLLAAGGNLSVTRLLAAYQRGIFPWFNKQDPILWWSPDPRMVLFTDRLHISKSLNKTLRSQRFKITLDQAFAEVIAACAAPRNRQDNSRDHATWIHNEMIQAYQSLYDLGYAHSVECWQGDLLVGGLYGVSIGRMFFGESMFSFATDSSKVALTALAQQLREWGFTLIDCQVHSDHLARLGAEDMSRALFVSQLRQLCSLPGKPGRWQLDDGLPYSI